MKEFLMVIAIFIGLSISVIVIANILTGESCYRSYEDYFPRYSMMTGCRIEYDGKLTPVEMIKNININ